MAEIFFEDTIAAVATPSGEGGIAVIRISGPEAFPILEKIFRPMKGQVGGFASHTIHLGYVTGAKEEKLDQVMASIFHAPHSYTGENVVEISVHGGQLVTRLALQRVLASGARYAEPGEFTRRAFLNGKLDLTQAEAVLDLIHAKSEKSLEVAMRQLGGGLSLKLKGLKDQLMKVYAHMEAFLDFPEEDLEVFQDAMLLEKIKNIEDEMARLIESFKRGSLLREGAAAVIVGRPNAGKSSLFNALLARDRALVSEFPGTTRDTLEETIVLAGASIRLFDTAGLSFGMHHPVDVMSMEKTRKIMQAANFFIFLVDGTSGLTEEDRFAFQEIEAIRQVNPEKMIFVVINKCDLPQKLDLNGLADLTKENCFIEVSAKTFKGLNRLEEQIAKIIMKGGGGEPGEESLTRLRHYSALEDALSALGRAEKAFSEKRSLEFVILDLKQSLDAIRELVGEVYSEDLLDVIFSEFCIGK